MDVSICIRNNPGIFIFSDHAARMLVGSLLMKEQLTGWLYTANAATVTSPSELLLSAWIIASRPNPQQLEKLEFAAYNLPSIFFQLWVVRQLLSESFNISSQSLYGIVIDK